MAGNNGAYHLADNPRLYEPQRSNNFEFIVMGIDSLLRASVDAGDTDAYIANGQETLIFSVVSASIPHFTQGKIEVKRGNSIAKFAGTAEYPSGSLKVNDFIGADSKSVLMAWQRLSYDVTTESVGRAADYKKDCTLVEYSPDYKQVRYFELKGC